MRIEPDYHDTKELLRELQKEFKTREDLHFLKKELKWQDLLEIFEQTVELIDLEPPQRKDGTLPVLVVPGFSGSAETWRKNADELRLLGRRTLCFNAPHGVQIALSENLKKKKLPFPQIQKAVVLIRALEKKGLTTVDAIGHSEAAITLTIAAKISPGMFQNIILMNPAGLVGSNNVGKTAFRFMIDRILDTGRRIVGFARRGQAAREAKRVQEVLAEATKTVAADPVQSIKEIVSISEAQIHQWIAELHEQKSAQFGLVLSEHDNLFPKKSMRTFIQKAEIQQTHIFTMHGGHDVVINEPSYAMKIADTSLEQMKASM